MIFDCAVEEDINCEVDEDQTDVDVDDDDDSDGDGDGDGTSSNTIPTETKYTFKIIKMTSPQYILRTTSTTDKT